MTSSAISVLHAAAYDRRQAALTARFLSPALPAIEQALLEMRADADLTLASAEPLYGKPYPYGCCLEITEAVLPRIRALRKGPARSAGERALATFLRQGGQVGMIWGVLRQSYFQNAFRIGSLYVDVANDTVDVNKPKVEILPLDRSGFETVRDGGHYAEIAERYWGLRCYANTALPSLAPLYPILAVDPRGCVQLQSDAGYMLRLFHANRFQLADSWLRIAPAPPDAVVAGLRQVAPRDLLAENPRYGLDASLEACARLRGAAAKYDLPWIEAMRAHYQAVPPLRVASASAPSVPGSLRAERE